jgi:hypothetical protein
MLGVEALAGLDIAIAGTVSHALGGCYTVLYADQY